MAAPIRTHIREPFEPMMDAVVQLGLVGIGLGVGLGYTFRDYLAVALLVACVLAVSALHTSSIFEEVSTICTSHDVIKLLLHELVTILLVNLFFALSYRSFATQSNVERFLVL